jgi:alpha-tubulin suppressor-like RCC1 family protein
VTWGYGASGVLGHGDYVSFTQPKLVQGGLHTKCVVYGECGSYHNAVITNDG